METITKAWYFAQSGQRKQRSVELMKEHRQQFGTSGNCFDLAIWFMHELSQEGITSYAVGHDLKTPDAHVAVVTLNEEGHRYFCDLGDQWIQPILIEKNRDSYCEDALEGFVTGGRIKVDAGSHEVQFSYLRPNGKVSRQKFDLEPIPYDQLLDAANHSQSLLRHPLVEMRLFQPGEVLHWEFDRWRSFISSNQGLVDESKLINNQEWAERIHTRTGMAQDLVYRSLDIYSQL
ncbi:hypothetical protein WMW72_07245 [Paenibacillus filicis]|uniref:Acetyltransferase n=1 Tax=Paenibacillus filicis TaxID=669464 RepID=A0ABU9DFR0_9BACL